MDDQIAISRLKQGDLHGLEHLVNRYQVQAVRAAYMILYDRALAEDVAQSAFVKVAERIDQFDVERLFSPWFFRIVVNDAIKLAKKQKRILSLDEQLEERVASFAGWFRSSNPGPQQLVEQNETRRDVLRAIQTLPPEQRAVIVMRYFLDMSEAEMSAKMERPFSTIKWWLRDARKRLRSLMDASKGG